MSKLRDKIVISKTPRPILSAVEIRAVLGFTKLTILSDEVTFGGDPAEIAAVVELTKDDIISFATDAVLEDLGITRMDISNLRAQWARANLISDH